MSSEGPLLPVTPRDALGVSQRERVTIDDRVFVLDRPTDSDRLLDHPAIQAYAHDQYAPYWTDLWPAARMLAKWIVRQRWPTGLRALEIGCGLGLAGIAALSQGVHVTFSDYDATALEFAAGNARLNGFTAFETLQLDWRYPPEGIRYSVLLASDLIYETRNVEPLVRLIGKLLAPVGVCLLADQDRIPAEKLRQQLQEQGLPYTTERLRAGEPGGRRLKGTLYRITLPGGGDPLLQSHGHLVPD